MPDITLSIREDVYKKMKEHKGISWAEIVRKAIVDYVYRLEVGKRELTTEELPRIGKPIPSIDVIVAAVALNTKKNI